MNLHNMIMAGVQPVAMVTKEREHEIVEQALSRIQEDHPPGNEVKFYLGYYGHDEGWGVYITTNPQLTPEYVNMPHYGNPTKEDITKIVQELRGIPIMGDEEIEIALEAKAGIVVVHRAQYNTEEYNKPQPGVLIPAWMTYVEIENCGSQEPYESTLMQYNVPRETMHRIKEFVTACENGDWDNSIEDLWISWSVSRKSAQKLMRGAA